VPPVSGKGLGRRAVGGAAREPPAGGRALAMGPETGRRARSGRRRRASAYSKVRVAGSAIGSRAFEKAAGQWELPGRGDWEETSKRRPSRKSGREGLRARLP